MAYALSEMTQNEERGGEMMVSFQGIHCAQDILLVGGRWSVAYPLSERHVAALLEEGGVSVDHAILQRWVGTDSPPRGRCSTAVSGPSGSVA